MSAPPAPEVRYGTAGWNFADWYGPFYPAPRPADDSPGSLFTGVLERAPDPDAALARRTPLLYYARFFDAVEVNSSFYGIPAAKSTARWAELTERGGGERGRPFLFSFKLPMPFTHEGRLDPPEVAAYRDALAPLRERDRLAAVVAQFPHAFSCTDAARARVARIAETFADLPLVVEVRHRTWQGCVDLLADLGVTLACIDQPQDATTLSPEATCTSPRLAYVRLHGRNAAAWFDRGAGRDQKYDYLYAPGEVAEWGDRVDALSRLAARTLVIANNHFRGQAPANALELRALREGPQAVPRALLEAYPRLRDVARSPGERPGG